MEGEGCSIYYMCIFICELKKWKHILQNIERSSCGGRATKQLITLCPQSGSKDWWMLYSANFLLSQPRVPAIVKGRSFPLSCISLEVSSETQTDMCLLILNPVKWTTKTHRHNKRGYANIITLGTTDLSIHYFVPIVGPGTSTHHRYWGMTIIPFISSILWKKGKS